MIALRKRLKMSPKLASREVVMRTWRLLIKQEREKERVMVRVKVRSCEFLVKLAQRT